MCQAMGGSDWRTGREEHGVAFVGGATGGDSAGGGGHAREDVGRIVAGAGGAGVGPSAIRSGKAEAAMAGERGVERGREGGAEEVFERGGHGASRAL